MRVCKTLTSALLTGTMWMSTGVIRAQSASVSDHAVETLYAAAKDAQASGDTKTAILKYEQILKIAPRLGPAYNNLGVLYIEEHDLAKAATVLEQGMKVDPDMKSSAALLGLVYFQMANFERARPYLQTAVKSNPTDLNSRMLLVKDLMNLHQEDAASVELHAILAHNPRNQEAWYMLGKAYLAMSISATQRAEEIDPSSVLSHEMAGEVMQSLQNVGGALVEYQKAVQMAPTQPGTHEHLADAFWEIAKWNSARKEYLEELANNPGDCTARWKAAHSLLEENGSSEQAITELNISLQQCPGLTGARLDHARALVSAGHPIEALPDLLEVEKVNAKDPSVHYLLAKVYRAQSRKSDAERELQIYSRLQQTAIEAVAKRATEVEAIKNNSN